MARKRRVFTEEFKQQESVKLQRCVVRGIRAVITRPEWHETIRNWGHGPAHLELVSALHLTSALSLTPGAAVAVEVGGDTEWWNAARWVT